MSASSPPTGDDGRPLCLLVNPAAGAGRSARLLPAVEAELRSRGARYRLVETAGLEHACSEARAAATAGEVPVVMSGDGMIGAVGGVLAGGEVPLGVIPGGRGNDFARALGIPTAPPDAVANLFAGTRRRIDVGLANDRPFLCIASCGFDSDANRLANEARLIKGPLVYAYAALRALIAWQPACFTLIADEGQEHRVRGYSIAAANSKAYGGGMFVAPRAELDDGLLDVVTTSDGTKLSFLRGLPSVFKGEHLRRPEVSCFRTAELRIEADRPFAVYADGEHITDLPVQIKLLPRALDVLAPAT